MKNENAPQIQTQLVADDLGVVEIPANAGCQPVVPAIPPEPVKMPELSSEEKSRGDFFTQVAPDAGGYPTPNTSN